MRRLLLGLIVAAQGCIGGCSAQHWGGDTAGKRPGVKLESSSLWNPASLEITSDCNANIGEVQYVGRTETTPSSLTIKNSAFGQSASAVVREEPAKIAATTQLQRVQVEYVNAMWDGVVATVREIMPALNLLAAARFRTTESGLTATLPNGLTIGRTRVSTPQDVTAYLNQVAGRLSTIVKVDPTATEPPATQPGVPGAPVAPTESNDERVTSLALELQELRARLWAAEHSAEVQP